MAPTPISVVQAAKSTPAKYTFAGGSEVLLESAYAEFDGSGSAASWLPSLAVYSPSGVLLGRGFPAAAVVAGDSAKVTFAPFPVAGAGGVTPAAAHIAAARINSTPVGVTTPWDYDDLAPYDLSGGSTDTTVLDNDGTYNALKCLKAVVVDFRAYLRVANNNASKLIPTVLECALVSWTTSGGTPSGAGPVIAETHRSWLLPAAAVDTNLTIASAGFYVAVNTSNFTLTAGKSYGLWFHATSATDNWTIAAGTFAFRNGYLV